MVHSLFLKYMVLKGKILDEKFLYQNISKVLENVIPSASVVMLSLKLYRLQE